MQRVGGDNAFQTIKNGQSAYLQKPGVVRFEQIYHCVHELLHFYPPTVGSVDEFRPLLLPFLTNSSGLQKDALGSRERKIIEVIYTQVSSFCARPKCSLYPLCEFLTRLRETHTTRIYSTNHDDFLSQAVDGLFTGFEMSPGSCARFDGRQFLNQTNKHALFHLHGSIHMAYGDMGAADMGELCLVP